MFKTIVSTAEFEDLRMEHPVMLAWFSTVECNVCKVLKPKVGEMVASCFPAMTMVYTEINALPELAARYRVFTVPTLLVFFEGREYIRKSRAFSIEELQEEITRLYARMEE
jgi:thioredoxin-like negative regulator of GroEL